MILLMNIVARKRGFADEAALPLTKLLVVLWTHLELEWEASNHREHHTRTEQRNTGDHRDDNMQRQETGGVVKMIEEEPY